MAAGCTGIIWPGDSDPRVVPSMARGLGWAFRGGALSDARQADALKLTCISQNFNDRRARAAPFD
jgi:hypothetical protein